MTFDNTDRMYSTNPWSTSRERYNCPFSQSRHAAGGRGGGDRRHHSEHLGGDLPGGAQQKHHLHAGPAGTAAAEDADNARVCRVTATSVHSSPAREGAGGQKDEV